MWDFFSKLVGALPPWFLVVLVAAIFVCAVWALPKLRRDKNGSMFIYYFKESLIMKYFKVLVGLFFMGFLFSCGANPHLAAKKVKTPVFLKDVNLNETADDPYFEFNFNTLLPVQDDGSFNAFIFPDLPDSYELRWAEGYVIDVPANTGHKVPGITHRSGFDTYGESVDILVVNPSLTGETHEVWITTNDLRSVTFLGLIRVYYSVAN
jgi:hypothetical protein